MLVHISIHDFAVVERLDLELGPGMTVLTGETGAGKSILIDALSLALGERASAGMIRPGASRADVSAVFDVADAPDAKAWLEARALGSGDECILRRSVSDDGRSRAYVNERPVPVGAAREIGDLLVDIHGQHEHQSLLRPDTQRQLLDDFGEHASLLAPLSTLHRRWKAAREERGALSGPSDERRARRELLEYQLRELEQLDLGAAEFDELRREFERLTHVDERIRSCEAILEALDGDDEHAMRRSVYRVRRELAELAEHEPELAGPRELLESVAIQLAEAGTDLRAYAEKLEPDPERLSAVDARLALIHDLARKHRVRPEELAGLPAELAAKLAELAGAETRASELEDTIRRVEQEYRALSESLHEKRKRAAGELEERVAANLERLGLGASRFVVRVEPNGPAQPTPAGLDRVELTVSMNPGHPLQPLARVVSGGELSRISLALQVVTVDGTHVPTVIFDEVDAGVGGAVAEIVGQQLRRLGARRQVLCVTHLAQVASQAHHHIQVSKEARRGRVHTRLQALDPDGRVEELARMLGGLEITEQTVAHAREMLTAGSR